MVNIFTPKLRCTLKLTLCHKIITRKNFHNHSLIAFEDHVTLKQQKTEAKQSRIKK